MNKGKSKCDFMRSIRKDVAEQYGLKYDPQPCTFEDDCPGTCPKCDAELADLQRQLDEKGIIGISLSDQEKVLAVSEDLQLEFESSEDGDHTAGIPYPENEDQTEGDPVDDTTVGIMDPEENNLLGEIFTNDPDYRG